MSKPAFSCLIAIIALIGFAGCAPSWESGGGGYSGGYGSSNDPYYGSGSGSGYSGYYGYPPNAGYGYGYSGGRDRDGDRHHHRDHHDDSSQRNERHHEERHEERHEQARRDPPVERRQFSEAQKREFVQRFERPSSGNSGGNQNSSVADILRKRKKD